MLNMVASIDGAAVLDGRSGGLSSPPDKQMFVALRAEADVIMVGAGTANVERYRRLRSPGARFAVVSGSLRIDPALPLFEIPLNGNTDLPLVVTTIEADGAAAAGLSGRAELLRAGSGTVDLRAALGELALRGYSVVLCEGGPTLNASLIAADLVDEVNLTVAPLAVGGPAPRVATGTDAGAGTRPPRGFVLDQAVADGDVLFLRWIRSSSRL